MRCAIHFVRSLDNKRNCNLNANHLCILIVVDATHTHRRNHFRCCLNMTREKHHHKKREKVLGE